MKIRIIYALGLVLAALLVTPLLGSAAAEKEEPKGGVLAETPQALTYRFNYKSIQIENSILLQNPEASMALLEGASLDHTMETQPPITPQFGSRPTVIIYSVNSFEDRTSNQLIEYLDGKHWPFLWVQMEGFFTPPNVYASLARSEMSPRVEASFTGQEFYNPNQNFKINLSEPEPLLPGQQKSLKIWWNKVYTSPTADEKFMGVSMALLKGAVVGTIWFSMEGVDPWLAMAMTSSMALYEMIVTSHMRTYDNILSGISKQHDHRKVGVRKYSARSEIFFRIVHATLMSYVWRMLGGPVGANHSLSTLQGHSEILFNIFAKSPYFWFSKVKHHKLSRQTAAWVGYPVFLVAMVLSNMDLFGVKLLDQFPMSPWGWGDLEIYQPSLPTLSLFGLYIGLGALIQSGPTRSIEKWMKRMNQLTAKLNEKRLNMARQFYSIAGTRPINSVNQMLCRNILSTLLPPYATRKK